MKEQKPIVIANMQKGVGPSPFVPGFSDIRNIDITTIPGAAKLNFSLGAVIPILGAQVSGTFTPTGSNNEATLSTTFRTGPWSLSQNLRPVRLSLSSGGSFPTGLAAVIGKGNLDQGGIVWLIDEGSTTVKFATSLANAIGGIAITFTTGSGSGTFYITSLSMGAPTYVTYCEGNSTYYLQDSYGQIWSAPYSAPQTWSILQGNTVNTSVTSVGGVDGSGNGVATNAYGQGLVVYNNYLLAFTDVSIEVYDIFNIQANSTASWLYFPSSGATLTWKTIQTVYLGVNGNSGYTDHIIFYNPTTVVVYWVETPRVSNQWALGSLVLTGATFNPYTSSTYTFSTAAASTEALDLPPDLIPRCMALQGSAGNIVIGTNGGLLLLWNGTTVTGVNSAIPTEEQDCTAMATVGNFIYMSIGYRGNIYFFNGYYTQKVAQIPPYLTQIPVSTVYISRMVKHNERLYLGVCNQNCGGIWSFNPTTNAITLEHTISENSYSMKIIPLLYSISNTSGFLPQAGIPSDTGTFDTDQLLVGWIDNSSVWGLDLNPGTNYYTTGYMETELMTLGTPNAPRFLNNYNIILGQRLTTGQSIQVFSRDNIGSAYSGTADATFDYTTYNAANTYTFLKLPIGKDAINRQFKTVLNCGGSTTTPIFNSIYID